MKDRSIKSYVPMVNTPHECLMCGQKTNWEERQRQAEKMRIHGLSIAELKDALEFARKRGWRQL